MDEENLVPLYYSISRSLTDAQVADVLHAFRITPIAAAIITDAHDGELARKLHDKVLQVSSLPEAHETARQYGEPTVIVTGDIELNAEIKAHHMDGSLEACPLS
jgi:hypothetical protein